MRRREFICLLGGAAAVWPMAAQSNERMRRVGALIPASRDNPVFQARVGAFLQTMALAGWVIEKNFQFNIHWAGIDANEIRRHAEQLAAGPDAPDVILTHASASVRALLHETRTVPIVFPVAGDPVASGFAKSLARPGGNATGFMSFEFSLSGKLPELLKQIAPKVTRAVVLRDPDVGTGVIQLAVIQAVAPFLRLEIVPANVHDLGEIERAIAAIAGSSDGGLIVTGGAASERYYDLISSLAAHHKLPAVYTNRSYAVRGGLASYGVDQVEQYRRAAGYVDRILKGEKPADLPVQAPTKYELVINLKTAKALGLKVPDTVLVRADEVIE